MTGQSGQSGGQAARSFWLLAISGSPLKTFESSLHGNSTRPMVVHV